MNLAVADEDALAEARPRNIRTYLRLHGWRRANDAQTIPDVWVHQSESDLFEVIAPSSQSNRDFVRRVSDLVQILAVVEGRSELEVLRDLLTLDFDIQYVRTTHSGPPGTAPLRDAAKLFAAAQTMIAAAAMSLEIQKPVLPTRRTARTNDLIRKVLAGPTSEGSYIVSLWIPVPPRLSPEEDNILFAVDDEPFERNVSLQVQSATIACREAAQLALDTDMGLDAFLSRAAAGVSANICEALVGIAGEEPAPFVLSFAWALDRPVRTPTEPVEFQPRLMPALESAAKEMRAMVPEEEVTARGSVVRLHRTEKGGPGEVTIAGFVVGDYEDTLRQISATLNDVAYDEAIRAHKEFREVEVSGPLIRRGSHLRVQEVRGFTVHEQLPARPGIQEVLPVELSGE